MRRGLSLRWKLVLGSLIVEVAMLTLLVVNSVRLIGSSLTEQAELRIKEVSILLNTSVGPNLAAQDYGPILDAFSASRREQGIVYFALWDTRKRLVALDGWPASTPLPPAQTKVDISTRNERFDIRIPISVGERRYGELQFGISTRFLLDARHQLTQQSIVIAGIEIVLSVVLLTLLGIWLTRHLHTLERASRDLSEGHYDVRLEVRSHDEIGTLSQAFNAMAGEISARLDALHESEERFRSLSQLSSDWFWEQDAELRFTRFTGGAFSNFPVIANELIGKRRWDTNLLLVPPAVMAQHRSMVEAHQPFRDFEYCAAASDNELRWFSISGLPIFNARGEFTGYHGTGKDITARKRSETALLESEAKFASLFQLSPLPLALTDLSDGRLRDVNAAWSRLLGHAHEEAIERTAETLQLFLNDNERKAFESLITRYGRCERIEARLQTRSGQQLICELSASTLEIGDSRYFLWCVRDVTEQRRIEHQARELNARLETRVAERTEELEKALNTLRMAQDELINSEKLAALGRVVAAVAHELNTPIGNSVMVATTLEAKAREFAGAVAGGAIRRSEINEFVNGNCAGTQLLMRNLNQAHELIHSFKQVAVDQTSDRRREFDLRTTIDEIATTLAPVLRKTPFRLSVDIPEGILLNSYPGPLGQVITNLVDNALAHAFEDMSAGSMLIEAKPVAGEQVEISFRDTGRGIEPAHLKRIFDPFFTTRLGRGGSGLGLNIVYNLVTRILGGRIEVSSTPGLGTSFLLRLPRTAPEQTSPPA